MDKCFEVYLNNGPSDTQIKTVNALLSSSKTNAAGWELLGSILNYCPADFFNENVTNWLDNCLSQNSQGNMTEIKLSVIEKFLEASTNNHELSKKIVSDYISKIVDFCLSNKLNSHMINLSLNVLILCMKRYGSWFVMRKIQIEKHIMSFLENNSEYTVNKAAVAFLYLQQIGNAGSDNINHRNNYKTAVQKLCSTLHNLLDTFLENQIEINTVERSNQEGYIFEDLPIYANKTASITAKRIKNVIIYLITMLKKSFTAPKQITPSEIINIIIRGTATQYCAHTVVEKELNIEFCLLLNTVQTQFIYLLRTLILWLRNSSFPYSFIISKILLDSLKKSQNCKCYSFNCTFQEAVYNCLKTWITVSKCGLNTHFQTELVLCIQKDITPLKTLLTLKNQKPTKTIHNKENTEFKNDKNDELKCLLALDTLTMLFSSSFIRIKENTMKDLFNSIWNIFNDINTKKSVHLYTNIKTQQKLYELLVSFYEQGTLKTSLPSTLRVLNNSLCDEHINVALTCKKGLDALERLCQPVSNPFEPVTKVTTVQSTVNEEIAGNDLVYIRDISPKEQNGIKILENKLLAGPTQSECLQNKCSSDMSISNSCFSHIIETATKTDQPSQSTVIEESESEPEIKRKKIDTEESVQTENIWTIPPDPTYSSQSEQSEDKAIIELKEPEVGTEKIDDKILSITPDISEEISSFVDEVEED